MAGKKWIRGTFLYAIRVWVYSSINSKKIGNMYTYIYVSIYIFIFIHVYLDTCIYKSESTPQTSIGVRKGIKG